MTHTDIINYFIEKYNYQSYLEIGLGEAINFLQINCKHKECVDPYEWSKDRDKSADVVEFVKNNILTYKMTSDDFFASITDDKKWDIIFIDGLHLEEQADKDILNSLKHLNKGGKIIVHDCIPFSKETQSEDVKDGTWNGTTWKSIPKLALMGINYMTIDTDYGCAVIDYTENSDELQLPQKADYEYDDVFKSEFIKRIMLRIIPESWMSLVY